MFLKLAGNKKMLASSQSDFQIILTLVVVFETAFISTQIDIVFRN